MISKGYPFIPIRTLQQKLKQGALNNMKLEKNEGIFLDKGDDNEIKSQHDPLELQMCEKNPWMVEEISEFLKYSCPECTTRIKNWNCFKSM